MKLLHIYHDVNLVRFLIDYKERNIDAVRYIQEYYIRGAKRLRSSALAGKNVSQLVIYNVSELFSSNYVGHQDEACSSPCLFDGGIGVF